MATSPDFDRIRDEYRVWIAAYQAEPGDQPTELASFWGGPGPELTAEEDVPSEVESAHRTLFRVEDPEGDTHWYWRIGGVEDWEDGIWAVVDLARTGGYKELAE